MASGMIPLNNRHWETSLQHPQNNNTDMLPIRIINNSPYPLPHYATSLSAGLDLQANIEHSIFLAPLERCLIPTGLYIEIPAGYEGQVRPRSGLAIKPGLTILNAPGTIDSDYRGELQVILINLSSDSVEIIPGERIAQLVFARHEQCRWVEVENLSDTERGNGGFGHTGI